MGTFRAAQQNHDAVLRQCHGMRCRHFMVQFPLAVTDASTLPPRSHRRVTDEALGDFMERLHSKIKQLKSMSKFLDWDRRYHKSVYEWAGHVAHIRASDSSRLTVKVAH